MDDSDRGHSGRRQWAHHSRRRHDHATDCRSSPEQIGLTLEEGQQLLRGIQMAIIGNQVHEYELRRRLCNDCGRRQRIKDTRRKCVQTAFGAFRLRGRRYRACRCQLREIGPVFFPLGEIIPRRTTPEVRFLFAESGASMPYREASRVLRTCGFGRMRASHAAIRRHTVAIGRDLEAQRMSAAQVRSGSPGDAAHAMVVGIDDTYVRHRERLTSRQIQITAGRLVRMEPWARVLRLCPRARAGTSGSSTDS